MNWINVKQDLPKEYGKYLVYRKGCNKWHSETWNGGQWAYNNNDITHWMKVIIPTLDLYELDKQFDEILGNLTDEDIDKFFSKHIPPKSQVIKEGKAEGRDRD
jgi:uncharacterized protein DUF551